jgi:hypothetical protein
MGNEDKKSLIDHAKSGLAKAQTGVAVVAKKGAKAVVSGAAAVRTGAGKAKNVIDSKTRAGLHNAYAAKKPLAVENLKQLRKAHPSASPSRVLELLNEDLHKVEQDSGSDPSTLIDAISTYVLTSVEVYGTSVRAKPATKKLINATLMFSSQAAKLTAKYGPMAVELAVAIIRKKGKPAPRKPVGVKKNVLIGPVVRFLLAKLVGVENVGRKSVTKIAEIAVKKALGTPPAKWPAATKHRSTPLK